MRFCIFTLLTALAAQDVSQTREARSLIATIEALQEGVTDFRCEYEGALNLFGKAAEGQHLGDDGLYEIFGGTFIWRKGGDTHSESLHRRGADGQILRESLVVRMAQQQAERYSRPNDAPLGYSVIKRPSEINSFHPGCFGRIFLIDKLKRDVADTNLVASVRDDQIDGRALKVVDFGLAGLHDSLLTRYYVDMHRGGHVVRVDSFSSGKVLDGRLEIELASFKVGESDVWMPVSGESKGYAAFVDKATVVLKEPQTHEKIYVVSGTMEFNKRPAADVFTIKYKPGTPISDHLRKLTYEFGQQPASPRPSKSDAQKMLDEQLEKAEAQKQELVVAPTSADGAWSASVIWAAGAAVALSCSAALWVRRRR